MPTPRPDTADTVVAEAGPEDEALDLAVGHRGEFGLGGQAGGKRLGANAIHR
jgi:hypothetical protein